MVILRSGPSAHVDPNVRLYRCSVALIVSETFRFLHANNKARMSGTELASS